MHFDLQPSQRLVEALAHQGVGKGCDALIPRAALDLSNDLNRQSGSGRGMACGKRHRSLAELLRSALIVLYQHQQAPCLNLIQFHPFTALQARGQVDRAEPHPHQAAYCHPDAFEHAAHFAIPALFQYHAIPMIGTLAALVRQLVEPGQPILQLDAGGQL